MRWRSPAALLRDAVEGARERQKDLRTLESNLPYDQLGAGDQPNRHYPGNAVKTAKYTPLLFLPVNLYEQFHRWANLYFVGLAALNFVPVVNAFQPEVALIPVCVMLGLTALKDGWEDLRRHKADRRLNNRPCLVYRGQGQRFTESRWRDVRVGDFVRLGSNEVVPADLLLLGCSDPQGVCLLETANLDGETDLKQRRAVAGLGGPASEFDPQNFNCLVVCERPNDDLNHFKCYVERPDKVRVGVGIESLLLRGCTVRNMEQVVGFVVYTGHESKSMLNINRPRSKRSKLERALNRDVVCCVALLLSMCLVGAAGHYIWRRSLPGTTPYLVPGTPGSLDAPSLSAFYTFFTMIILLQILIPISLYVSIELVKMAQVFFITNDVDLYDAAADRRVQCRALNITEDLGQIQYVFSDKTGTLTENKMVFGRCSVMGTEYPHEDNAVRRAAINEEPVFDQRPPRRRHPDWTLAGGEEEEEEEEEEESGSGAGRPPQAAPPRSKAAGSAQGDMAFSSLPEKEVVPDRALLQQIVKIDFSRGGREVDPYLDFFLALAVCNTVVVSTATAQRERLSQLSSASVSTGPSYTLSSLAQKVGSLCRSLASWKPLSWRESQDSRVLAPEEEEEMDKEEERGVMPRRAVDLGAPRSCRLPVDSDEVLFEAESPDEAALVRAAKAYGFTLLARGPAGVAVRLPHGERLELEVLDILSFDAHRKRMSVLVRHPVTGEMVLYTKGADHTIMELLRAPCAEPLNDDQKSVAANCQKHLDQYAKEGLRTLCFTRKTVSESEYSEWSTLRQTALAAMDNRGGLVRDSAVHLERDLTLLGATGIEDRLQDGVPDTVVALREAGLRVWVLTGDKPETAVNIAYACRLLDEGDVVVNVSSEDKRQCASMFDCTLEAVRRYQLGPDGAVTDPTVAMVIDGRTLAMALESDLQERFVELARRCRAVLCCRVTPVQKSAVVKVIRDKLKVMTLAVGDGANDVNMIQAADVGIGISGQEGMQAVMASDFAICRFKHLRKLVLVHGHWCHSRLAHMIVYFFYKNVAYVNLLFWYQFYCGFSGATVIDIWLVIFFNLFYTSVPPIMFGIMDRDVSAETLMGLPELYREGKGEYKSSIFWVAILDAFYQSLVCFFIPYLTYQGSDIDVFTFGTPLNTVSLFTILLHLSIEIKAWTAVHLGVMLGSVGVFFVSILAYNALCVTCNPPANPYWTLQTQMGDPVFYLVCLLTTVVALLPRYTFHVLRNTLRPSPMLLARNLERLAPAARRRWIEEWGGMRGGSASPVPVQDPSPSPPPGHHHHRLNLPGGRRWRTEADQTPAR